MINLWVRMRTTFEGRRRQIFALLWSLCAAAVVVGWQVDALQSWIIDSGALQLLILGALLELSVQVSKALSPADRVAAVEAALADNTEVMRSVRGGVGPVVVVAYTGVNALRLLRALADAARETRLLLAEPGGLSEALRREVSTTVSRLADDAAYQRFIKVEFYAGTPRMHGVLFHDLVVIGWFESSTGQASKGEPLRYPMVLAHTKTDEGRRLWEMLDHEISTLGKATGQVPQGDPRSGPTPTV